MNKNDYIHLFREACGGRCNAEYNPCAFRQAADSLAALKPVAWKTNFAGNIYFIPRFTGDHDGKAIPLFALEANNET